MNAPSREHWGTRLGLVLAMAGNAIGLGNFLRFPGNAAANGGGAFMIPYFVAMLLLAVPVMWLEWAMGRYGGTRGHGTTPGMFHLLWKHPVAKYFGVFGLFIPLTVAVYYTYIESWCLGYAYHALMGHFGQFAGDASRARAFFNDYTGGTGFFGGTFSTDLLFYGITILLNASILYWGISKGIEVLAKVAMPALFLFAVILIIRIFSLSAPSGAPADQSPWNGLGFVWNPNFSLLFSDRFASIWLAATGQVFFTLSLGFGAIQCYASYLRKKDDVALTGLATASANEFAEVILGSCIAIPIAFTFFGQAGTEGYAGSTFALGFQAMPLAFAQIHGGALFGLLWFLLLFFAGITSSVALAQPGVALLEDEFGLTRRQASLGVWFLIVGLSIAVVFGKGVDDEMDFWAGTFLVVVFVLVEVVLFAWVFGIDKAWKEITDGADMRVPVVFRYILKYVTPVYLVILLVAWGYQDAIPRLFMNPVRNTIARPELRAALEDVGVKLDPSDAAPAGDPAKAKALQTLADFVLDEKRDLLRHGTQVEFQAALADPANGLSDAQRRQVLARYENVLDFLDPLKHVDEEVRADLVSRHRELLASANTEAAWRWGARGLMLALLAVLVILVACGRSRIEHQQPEEP